MQHFIRGLNSDSAKLLDKASGGAFAYKTVREAREILNKILDNTPFIDVYEEEPIEEVQTLAQTSSQEPSVPEREITSHSISFESLPVSTPSTFSEPISQPLMDPYDSPLDLPYTF